VFINSRVRALHFNTWAALSIIFVVLVVLPNLSILTNALKPGNENWAHISQYLLKDYIVNSMILIVFTGALSVIIGISLAWLVSAYDFPFRHFFSWALVLPLAIPPYIAAYTYHGLLNYTGVIQAFLRNHLNLRVDQAYFDIMNIKGAIFIFTMFLFPYVYIMTRSYLQRQSATLVETARLLGRNPWEVFVFVVLPLSRAAIVSGVSLVILEVLNDYGVVKYFGIPAFSTAIFKTWFGMGDIDSAVKLSAILMSIVLVLLLLERLLRANRRFSATTTRGRPIVRQRLTGRSAGAALGFAAGIFGLSFIIPTLQLLHWAVLSYANTWHVDLRPLIVNSLFVAGMSAVLITVVAVVVANYSRVSSGPTVQALSRLITIGYSIPGAVIAIGVIVFVIGLDHRLAWFYQLLSIGSDKLVLSTNLVMLLFAYLIRFLAIGYNSIDAGFEKVGTKLYEASRTLGKTMTQTFFQVDLPLLRLAVIGSFILVFIDILKELPLTMILRPFNFDTLATKAFEYANDEMIHEAALPSLVIILASAAAVYVFNRLINEEEV